MNSGRSNGGGQVGEAVQLTDDVIVGAYSLLQGQKASSAAAINHNNSNNHINFQNSYDNNVSVNNNYYGGNYLPVSPNRVRRVASFSHQQQQQQHRQNHHHHQQQQNYNRTISIATATAGVKLKPLQSPAPSDDRLPGIRDVLSRHFIDQSSTRRVSALQPNDHAHQNTFYQIPMLNNNNAISRQQQNGGHQHVPTAVAVSQFRAQNRHSFSSSESISPQRNQSNEVPSGIRTSKMPRHSSAHDLTSAVDSSIMYFRNFAIQMGSKSTNLTSNQHGSAVCDKQSYSGVLNNSCILASMDIIDSFSDHRPTINNKLKALKFIEHLNFRLELHFSGKKLIEFARFPSGTDLVAVVRAEGDFSSRNSRRKGAEAEKDSNVHDYHLLRKGAEYGIVIFRKGKRIFPVTDKQIKDFWERGPSTSPINLNQEIISLQDDDVIILCRGYNVAKRETSLEALGKLAESAEDAIAKGEDLDSLLPPQGQTLNHIETAVVMGVVGAKFDEYFEQATEGTRLSHLMHLEKAGALAFDDPWPYAITKHTLISRPYLAMTYFDASKINRFAPTIEFLVRKALACPLGLNFPAMLGKLSEIQYMAGALLESNQQLRYWATGGAFLVIIKSSQNGNNAGHLPNQGQSHINFPGLANWTLEATSLSIPMSNLTVGPNDLVFLGCPSIRRHFSQLDFRNLLTAPLSWKDKLHEISRRLSATGLVRKVGVGLFAIQSPQSFALNS